MNTFYSGTLAVLLSLVSLNGLASETFYPAEVAVFFSPKGGAEKAIVSAIDDAKHEIRMQAFLFSNKPITEALIRAHKRGVKVTVLIDQKMVGKKPNTTNLILDAEIPTFFDTAHRTAHDKIIIIDDSTVLTGSFNFVKVAETKNGENLIVLKSKPVAEQYIENWKKHFSHSEKASDFLNKKGAEAPNINRTN